MTFYDQPRRSIGETLLTLAFGLVITALALQAMLTVAVHWLAVLAPDSASLMTGASAERSPPPHSDDTLLDYVTTYNCACSKALLACDSYPNSDMGNTCTRCLCLSNVSRH